MDFKEFDSKFKFMLAEEKESKKDSKDEKSEDMDSEEDHPKFPKKTAVDLEPEVEVGTGNQPY